MDNEKQEVVSSDLPLTDPANDELGYAPFARGLARSIQQMVSPQGYVVAINGEWGLGKSTVVSFIQSYLQQEEADKQPLIVQFAPWMFSGQEDLTRNFCEQLFATMTSDQRWRSVATNIKRPLTNLANTLSEAPVIGGYAKPVAKVLGAKQDIQALKKAVSDELSKSNRRVLVVIDDIDRLAPDEIQQLFRVIKAVANFPNVIYLVVFDREIVAKALTTNAMSGAAYLEKIVQASFDVPLPSRIKLRNLFTRRLDIIIRDVPGEIDNNYWANIYLEGVEHFLTTPRDVIRLINALSVTVPMIRDEVNIVDFVALETLRVFCLEMYNTIRNNKGMFTGYVPLGSRRDYEDQERKTFHNAWLERLPADDKGAVKALLQYLFPKLNSIFGNTFYGDDSWARWRKDYRICVEDRFDVYFQYSLPEGMLSRAEVQTFIAQTQDVQALKATFWILLRSKEDRVDKIRTYLSQLDEQIREGVPLENIPNVIEAMFVVGDDLVLADEKRGMFDMGNEMTISRIIRWGLKRFDEPQRFGILKEKIAFGTAFATIVDQVTMLGTDHDKHPYGRSRPPEEQELTAEHVTELEAMAADKIRKAVADNTLISAPSLFGILYRWRDWTGEEEPQKWVAQTTETDEGLMTFLDKIVTVTRSIGTGQRFEQLAYKIDLNNLDPFMDASWYVERVSTLVSQDRWTNQQKLAGRAFLKGVLAREAGLNPADVDDEDER